MTVDVAVRHDGKPSACVRSKSPNADRFGTLMQNVRPDRYRRHRLRFSGWVRSEEVRGWAGLWMRVDCGKRGICAFDNMQSRPIKGTTGWTKYEVVLDVAEDATRVAFGLVLSRTGQVWMSGLELAVVDRSVPSTDISGKDEINDTPQNLDFTR